MGLTHHPEGVSSFGIPVLGGGDIPATLGNVFFVHSGTGSNGNSGGPEDPFATIDYAINQCTASQADTILLLPGHAETLTAASAITCDVAGIRIIGLGEGANRPTLTFGTSTAASVVISAANTVIRNIVGIGNIDGLTNPFHVQAADCVLDIEWRDASDTVEAARVILGTAAADRLRVRLRHYGRTGGDAGVNAIRLVGTDGADIDIVAYGKASTGWVEFLTTACTNIRVRGSFYNSGTTDLSKNVVDTAGSSTWSVEGFDAAAGQAFSGGSAAAIAGDDVASVIAALHGTAGVASYPSAAKAANAVSLAEVLRLVQNHAAMEALDRNSDNYIAVTADFTSATWNTVATHEILTITGTVRLRIVAEATGNGAGATATAELGIEGVTNAFIGTTTITDFVTGELWYDTSPTTFTDTLALAVLDRIVSAGKDVGYEIKTAAATGGGIIFHVWWTPISSDGAVVAGAGGTL